MTTKTLHLIARIGGIAIALDSADIESVVKVGEVIGVPRTEPALAGLLAVRSRVLTLIDSHQRVFGAPIAVADPLAIVSTVSQHSYGLLVDAVEDVVELNPAAMSPPTGVDACWLPYVTALAQHDGRLLLVADRAALILGPAERWGDQINPPLTLVA